MTDFTAKELDVRALQERVRADRHVASYPLIVIGSVGFHYASLQLGGWIPIIYGLPLSFVALAAVQWRHERRRGVGAGTDEALVIAFAVLLGTALAMSDTWRALLPPAVNEYDMTWLFLPTAVGLGVVGIRQRTRSLLGWAATIVVACVLADVFRSSSLQPPWTDHSTSYQTLLPQLAFGATTAAGLLRFRAETAAPPV